MDKQVVISKHKENTGWVEQLDCDYIVYDKSGDIIEADSHCVYLKKQLTGDDSHTYLYHIVNNYNNLADCTFFVQGDPFEHCQNVLDIIKNNPLIHFIPLGNIYCVDIIQEKISTKELFIKGAQFALSKQCILSIPLCFFETALEISCNPHYKYSGYGFKSMWMKIMCRNGYIKKQTEKYIKENNLVKKQIHKATLTEQYDISIYKKKLVKKYQEIFNKYTISDFAIDYGISHYIYSQHLPDEFKILLDIYINKNPQRILEIGTANGGTLYYWVKFGEFPKTVVSVDISHNNLLHTQWDVNTDNLILITGNSNNIDICESVEKACSQYDFIFIDGNHSDPYPLNDFLLYSKLAASGCIVVLHDIQGSLGNYGAKIAWEYILKSNYNTCEFVHPDMSDFGIGVVFL